jgi:hypothetical protein
MDKKWKGNYMVDNHFYFGLVVEHRIPEGQTGEQHEKIEQLFLLHHDNQFLNSNRSALIM